MKSLYFVVLALLIGCFCANVQASGLEVKKTSIEDLAWLCGNWVNSENGSTFEECWMAPKGDIMIGMGRKTRDKKQEFYEYLRIESKEDGIYYVAQPFGKSPTSFKLTKSSGDCLLFENRGHDFPKFIEYALGKSNGLSITVRGDGTEKEKPFTFKMHRQDNQVGGELSSFKVDPDALDESHYSPRFPCRFKTSEPVRLIPCPNGSKN